MISAFDIATKLTGWCAGAGVDRPLVGVFEFPQYDDRYGELGDHFRRYLDAHFERFSPTAVVYEAPILLVKGRQGSNRTDKLQTLRKLYGMGFLLEAYCAGRRVPCHEVGIREIKREVTGNSRAEKDDMVAVARKVGLALPDGPGRKDAADAWGAWLLALRHYDKRLSARWDALIWGPRGALL